MGATVPKLRGRPWRRGSCSSTSRHFAPRSAGALSRNCDRQVAPKQSRRYPSASEAHACDPNAALTSRATQPVRACPGPAPTSKQGCAHPATDRRPPNGCAAQHDRQRLQCKCKCKCAQETNLNARVHAEAAGGWEPVGGVAGQERPPALVALRYLRSAPLASYTYLRHLRSVPLATYLPAAPAQCSAT